MNRLSYLCAGLTLVVLAACAAPQGPSAPATPSDTTPPAVRPPAVGSAELPCAEVDTAAGLQVNYTGESLYRKGAVLPKPEGLACLDVLSAWLKSVPQATWQVTVSGEEGVGFDPVALAGKRSELLQRYFARKGVDTQGWTWQAAKSAGAQLQLSEAAATGSP